MNIQHDRSEIIDVDIPINYKLDKTSSSFPKHTIFKVHALLRAQNEMAYEPNIVAIGPYHRGKDRLRVMEDLKLRWFKSNLEKLEESNATKYFEAMKRLEPEARQCYSESTENMSQDEFAEMLLLDACFIIQFTRWCLRGKPNEGDPSFQVWNMYSSIFDLLLFENQIPLFVLQELYSMIKLPQEPTHFHDLALKFLYEIPEAIFKIPEGTIGKHVSLSDVSDIEHILGLLHYTVRSVVVNDDGRDSLSDKTAKRTIQLCETAWFKFINNQLRKYECGWFDQKDRNNICDLSKYEYIPSATKLHAAGVKFRIKKVEGSPLGINFENGVMEIPKFILADGTERLYRNLIAYEEYNQDVNNRCIGLHAKLMDCLIDSGEDVALLRSFGMVFSVQGDDEEVSTMLNKLGSHVYVANTIYDARAATIFEKVNVYYGKRRHRWMAKLRNDYFNSPWALISFLAALFLLLLTVIQTIFSILGGV